MVDDFLTSRNEVFASLPDYLQGVLAASPLSVLARRQEAAMRALPTTAKGERTVEQILDVTDELFATADLDSITTNRVAEVLGANVATIYRYFSNLDSIVAMVSLRYELRLHLMLAVLFEPIAHAQDWRSELRSIVEAIARYRISTPSRPPIAAVVQLRRDYRPIADAINQTSGQLLGSILYRRRSELELTWWFEIAKVSSVILRSGLSAACSAVPPDMVHVELLKDSLERYFQPYVEDPVESLGLAGRVFGRGGR